MENKPRVNGSEFSSCLKAVGSSQLAVGWEAAFDQAPRSERRGQRKVEIAVVCPCV